MKLCNSLRLHGIISSNMQDYTPKQDRPIITLFSIPLVSTWVFDETRRILFDAGDGAAAHLDQKIAAVRTIALSHSHRDHISGLPQMLNLRAGAGDLIGIYPKDSGAIRAFAEFLSQLDRNTSAKTEWHPFDENSKLVLPDERLFLDSFINRHVAGNSSDKVMSLGYRIIRRVPKLRPELQELSQAELDAIRIEQGLSALVSEQDHIIFCFSGDTAKIDSDVCAEADYLLHECTFLYSDDGDTFDAEENGHSVLCDVLDTAIKAKVQHLGLYHISRRYGDNEIISAIINACNEKNVPFPVSAAMPGRYTNDLFGKVIWH